MMASLTRMAQEGGAVSDSVAPPYPLDRVVAYVGVVCICQVPISLRENPCAIHRRRCFGG